MGRENSKLVKKYFIILILLVVSVLGVGFPKNNSDDAFFIASSDSCIGVLNGRVPDEATVIKMGIAYGTGIPVILYKNDARALFKNGDNGMILGLNKDFKTIKKIALGWVMTPVLSLILAAAGYAIFY